MKNDELLDQLIREARQLPPPAIDERALEEKLMARIAAGDGPRWPLPAPTPARWKPAALTLSLAAAAALMWVSSQPPAPSAHSPVASATLAPTAPARTPTVKLTQLDVGAAGQRMEVPGMAALWLDPHSHGVLRESADKMVVELRDGAVALEVQPQPAPDRVVVLAGGMRVSVKGTKFRVAYRSDQGVDVDVEHGAVAVQAIEGTTETMLRGPAGGSFSRAGAPHLRAALPFAMKLSPAPTAMNDLAPPAPPPSSVAPVLVPSQPPAARPSAPVPSAAPAASVTLPSEGELRAAAQALAIACLRSSSNIPPNVVVSIESELTVQTDATGHADELSFAPPLSPAVEQCVQRGKGQLQGPPGRVSVPVSVSFGAR